MVYTVSKFLVEVYTMSKMVQVLFKATEEEKLMWTEAGKGNLSSWLRGVANRACQSAGLEEPVVKNAVKEESFDIPASPPKVKRNGKELCGRCTRIGVPSCAECLKAHAESSVEEFEELS